jgi:predicted NBD/HSP70 family sugar kinase
MLGNQNRTAILNFIKTNSPISRADIARKLNVSAPSVSKSVNILIEAGIVKESGRVDLEYGRKPTLIEFNHEFLFVIGVEINESSLIGVVANLSGDIKQNIEIPSHAEAGGKGVYSSLITLLNKLIGQMEDLKNRIEYIVISSPGLVDPKNNRLILATFIEGWDEIDLKKGLEKKFGIKTLIVNDVDADIVGERWRGAGRDFNNLLYLKLGDGVAARMILNGELYSGNNSAAGEIGYIVPGKEFIRKEFQPRGVLENLICNDAINSMYTSRKTKKQENQETPDTQVDIERLIHLKENGDPIALNIYKGVMDFIILLLINTLSVLDPEMVILGGELSALPDKDIRGLVKELKNHIPFIPLLKRAALGKMTGVTGCIRVGLDNAEEELMSLW